MIAEYRLYTLPWDSSPEQEKRFHDTVRNVVVGLLLLALLVTFLPTKELSIDEMETVPPRFAKLLLEKSEPPPPPPVAAPRPEPVKPEQVVAEVRPVEKVPEPVVEAAPPPVDTIEKAREKAAVAGLLPFADELAELRDNQVVANVTDQQQMAGATGEASRAERSLITSRAGKASGGINTAAMSRNTGGAGLAQRETTAVSSTVAGLATGSAPARSGDSSRPARSREEIEMVFDKNKGAIYALYNRALRRDPTLQGKLVLKLTIEPSGAVSYCEVISSELTDEELERKLIQRIKLFRFVEKNVAPVTTTKPIDFFPA
jgi:protein TonB